MIHICQKSPQNPKINQHNHIIHRDFSARSAAKRVFQERAASFQPQARPPKPLETPQNHNPYPGGTYEELHGGWAAVDGLLANESESARLGHNGSTYDARAGVILGIYTNRHSAVGSPSIVLPWASGGRGGGGWRGDGPSDLLRQPRDGDVWDFRLRLVLYGVFSDFFGEKISSFLYVLITF